MVGGALAAVVVWLIAKYVFDAELRAQAFGSTEKADIGAAGVAFGAILWSLVGWGLLAIMERFMARGRTVWTWTAVVLTVLSLLSPLLTPDLTAGTRIALSIMHVAAAAVVIPIFARTSPRS